MSFLPLIGTGLLCAAVVMTMRALGAKAAPIAAAVCGVLIVAFFFTRYGSLFSEFADLAGASGLSPYVPVLLKVLGIGYVTQFAADTCRDLGEAGIASKVELCGRGEILLLCLPHFKTLLDVALGLTEGL